MVVHLGCRGGIKTGFWIGLPLSDVQTGMRSVRMETGMQIGLRTEVAFRLSKWTSAVPCPLTSEKRCTVHLPTEDG